MKMQFLKACCDGDFVAAYEEMRKVVVEHLPGLGSVGGMGIVLNRGLAAWIDASTSTRPAPTTSEQTFPKQCAHGKMTREFEVEMVAILAGMSISALGEGVR